jgi:hypothetical protein
MGHENGDALAREVRRAIEARSSVNASELKKSLPKEMRPLLEDALEVARALAARGALFRWAKGKKERFFLADPVETLDRLAPQLLSSPLTAPELKKALEKSARGHGDLFAEWLKSALARGIVFPAAPAPRSKAKRIARAPDARLALAKPLAALKKALPKLDELGIDRAQIAAVILEELGVESADDRDAFLSALRSLAARSPDGMLLSVRELRAQLPFDKPRFDALALDLSRDGLIALHHHDFPTSLPEHERAALIEDARGTHYVGIVPKRPS